MSILAAACVALACFYLVWRSRVAYLRLERLPVETLSTSEDHCVIIPARDEEDVIERAVRSFEGSLTVVVDDHSGDRTAEVAAAAGAEVRQALPLEPRWAGKSNACWTGARLTESKWILFADADAWFDPGFLPSLLEYAAANELHAATVLPRYEMEAWWQQALIPYVSGLFFAGVNTRAVIDPKRPAALANGQCLLFLRSAYDFLGGHGAVASDLMDGLALARLMKRHRMNVGVLRCETHAHVRACRSFRSLWGQFDRYCFRWLRANPWAGAQAAAASLLMAAWLPVLGWLYSGGHTAVAWCFLALPTLVWLPWYRSSRRALLAPSAIYLFQTLAVLAVIKHLSGWRAIWKGRPV